MNAIEVDRVCREFAGRNILQDISFRVQKGKIHGLLGPNGAGKTTTMRILSGLMQPTAGEVFIEGTKISNFQKNLYQKIGFLIEDAPLFKEMTVKDYLHYVARLRRVPENKLSDQYNYCIEALDLGEVVERSIENLSRGFKQRVGIAQAIIHMPDIVFLDEPNLGLDPKAISEMRSLIQNLKEQHTIVLSSHLLHEMSLVCDDITVISHGKILESGDLQQIKQGLELGQTIIIEATEPRLDFETYMNDSMYVESFRKIAIKEHVQYHITHKTNEELRPQLVEAAVECGLSVLAVEKSQLSLEEMFLRITSDG